MKVSRIQWLAVFTVVLMVGMSTDVFAQGMFGAGRGTTRDPSRGLGRLLGTNFAFSATSKTVSKETARSNPETTEYGFALLNGKSRVEMDMTKSAKADEVEMMKKMGMDLLVIINTPGSTTYVLMYPGMKSYCEMPVTQSDTADAAATAQRTELGNETVDGHPCVKTKVTTTKADGTTSDSLVWEATDLRRFPVQSEIPTARGGTSTTLFKNIKLERPAASLFEPPADFTKYDSMQAMIMGGAQKMMR